MKQLSLFFLFLQLITRSLFSDPLLVIVLMVKDEASAMRETLQPFLDAGIDSYVILDTGSTDDTITITRKLFAEYGVQHGYIIEQPFVDFATSRNYALSYAEEKFPDAAFLLMPDAEWYMHNVQRLLQFCAMHDKALVNSFLVRITDTTTDFYTQRLFKPHWGMRFEGAVHETLNQISYIRVPDDIYFELRTCAEGKKKSQQRWVHDRDIFLDEYEKNPNNPRTLFYLGQTCACLGEWEQARDWYTKRCEIYGWDEENFLARYRLAQVYETLGNWEQAEQYYLAAHRTRPTRAEPLVKLAQHYWSKHEYALCFSYVQQAVNIPYPHQDLLFVEKKLYDYTRYDLLGQVAWYVGEFELGKKALVEVLEGYPDEPHLHTNLAWYLEREEANS